MFYTQNYKHGWIHESHYAGLRATWRAQAPDYRDLGEFKSLHAAKLAITREAAARRLAQPHHPRVENS